MELTEKELVLFSNYKVTSADTDMEGRLRPGALLNFLIQSAISSADYLGFGFGGIKAQELFWVLSRLTVEIHRPMKWYEPLEVETWPKDIERIIYLRDFIMRDSEKNIVGKATSGWLALDMKSKRPKRIEGIHAEIFERLKMKSAIITLPEKLNSVVEGEIYEIKSSYYDIDLNRHVTSTRYIDWMMDSFPIEFHNSNYPFKISMNYLKETMPGETIKILRKETGENQYSFEGKNMTSASDAFRGRIDFSSI